LLSRPLDPEAQVVREKETRSRSRERGSLFERLRKLRHQISLEENIPAYLVFNDSALKEMEIKKPVNEEEFMRISGVGQRKLDVYGELFIKEIKDFQGQKKKKTESSQTFNATYELYKKGKGIEEIAQIRELKPTTIFSHLIKLYLEGKEIDIYQFVDRETVAQVAKAKKALENPVGLKPYFEYFKEEMEYDTIRLALSVIEKNE